MQTALRNERAVATLRQMLHFFAFIRRTILFYAVMIWRTRALWVRALLCLAVGVGLLINDENANFDLRLQIRGPRRASDRILIVDISDRELNQFNQDTRNVLRPLKEVVSFSDSFFWDQHAWPAAMQRILAAKPAAIGATFFFGDSIRTQRLRESDRALLKDPRIVWATDLDGAGRIMTPVFHSAYNSNVAVRTVRADDDGIVRRFSSPPDEPAHLGLRLAQAFDSELGGNARKTYARPALINFRGNAEMFNVVSFSDVLNERVPPAIFQGRIVFIGSVSTSFDRMQTPLGPMTRTEIIANITDNVLSRATVSRLPSAVYILMLFVLMGFSFWLITSYPQSVALLCFVMTGAIWAAGGVWTFDVLKIWIPTLSPLAQLTFTYIAFLSYQLTLNERRTWRLEQEQKYRGEIERLKTNFVSMMSHDLKTPIAKIQAICDRLLTSMSDAAYTQDILSLRSASDDLHRYIQSILQVTKIEAKDFKITKEVADINENIEKAVSRLGPLASEKGIRIETRLEPMFSIEADTTLIQEVIHNLVENAIKYTPRAGRVTVSSQEKDDKVVVVVEDTGPGIDPAERGQIWHKFTRGRRHNMETKGSGLGLYLVKYFVELHGGEVFLDNEFDSGTRIGFSIPVAARAEEQAVAESV